MPLKTPTIIAHDKKQYLISFDETFMWHKQKYVENNKTIVKIVEKWYWFSTPLV